MLQNSEVGCLETIVERRLCTLKHSVRNQATPQGSIAEAYVANEALTFGSRYFTADDVAR
jgi:hypothetical protein